MLLKSISSYDDLLENHKGCRTTPPPMSGFHFFFVAVPYSVIFVVGLMGNTAVLTYILFLTKSLRGSIFSLGNTLVYVLALSLVDLMVIFSIPFHLTSILMANWVYGTISCKAYWVLEMSNKLCSAFILTAMAFDRYMAVCHSNVTWVHSIRSTVIIIIGSLCISVFIITPVIYLSRVAQVPMSEAYVSYRMNGSFSVCLIERNFCSDGMTRNFRYWFSVLIFVFAFLLPAVSLCFCYIKMSFSLRKKARSLMQSHIPIGRVTTYAFTVIIFFLMSQAPYWITQIYTTFLLFINQSFGNVIYITYICHMCPFLAAALNWILYARMNTQVRKGLSMANEHYSRDIRRRYADPPMSEYNPNHNTTELLTVGYGVKACDSCGQPLYRRDLLHAVTKTCTNTTSVRTAIDTTSIVGIASNDGISGIKKVDNIATDITEATTAVPVVPALNTAVETKPTAAAADRFGASVDARHALTAQKLTLNELKKNW